MKLKFLQMTPSGNSDFPFQAGQIIEIPRLTREFCIAIEHGHAEVLRDDPDDISEPVAVVAAERAVLKRGKRK